MAYDPEKLIQLTQEQEKIWLDAQRTVVRLIFWWMVPFFIIIAGFGMMIYESESSVYVWSVEEELDFMPYLSVIALVVLLLEATIFFVMWQAYKRPKKAISVEPENSMLRLFGYIFVAFIAFCISAAIVSYMGMSVYSISFALWPAAHGLAAVIIGVSNYRLRSMGVGKVLLESHGKYKEHY